MNQGTYYLYEYNKNHPLHCIGFIRVKEHYHSCILQIHARISSALDDDEFILSAFILTGNGISVSRIGALTCRRQEINARISVAERTFPDACTLNEIDGFLIRSTNDDPAATGQSVFWVAADPLPPAEAFFTPSVEPEAVPEKPAPESPDPENSFPETPESELPPDSDIDLESAEKKSEIQARKIKRSDLTLLPRRFWSLANNSFLLHGYHNYNHLLLLEDNGRLWLGVPGIYDPREARAADLFGFPQFTREGVSALDLCDNECCADENFGHWCRCIR